MEFLYDFSPKHFSLIIGPYQSGKDSFIYNLRKDEISNEENKEKEISTTRETTEIKLLEYKNSNLIENQQCCILNTPGFANPHNMKDEEIVINILKWVISQKIEKINSVFLIQSLSEPCIVEKCIKCLKIAFGDEIVKSSIIIATKSNNLDADDYHEKINDLKDLATKYGLKGGVYDFRGYYFVKTKNELKEKNLSNSKSDVDKQISEIGEIIKKLLPFDLGKLHQEIDNSFKIAQAHILNKKKEMSFWDYVVYYVFFGWIKAFFRGDDSNTDNEQFLKENKLEIKKNSEEEFFNEIRQKLNIKNLKKI